VLSLGIVEVKCHLRVDSAVMVAYENLPDGSSSFVFGRDDQKGDFEWVWRDGYTASNEFLRANSPGSLLRLFRKCGPLQKDQTAISLEKVRELQDMAIQMRSGKSSYKKLMKLNAITQDALGKGAPWDDRIDLLLSLPVLRPTWTSPLRLEAECEDLIEASCIALFIDKANQRDTLLCGRDGCGREFSRRNGTRKYYCSRTCAQRVADNSYKARKSEDRVIVK
jgi:hypothetical protein